MTIIKNYPVQDFATTAIKNEEKIVLTNSLSQYFKKILVGRKKFICGWYKLNGDFRSGTFDLLKRKKWTTAEGVEKKLSTKKNKRNIAQWVYNTYSVVFDYNKQDYRRINYNTIRYLEIPADKIKYVVDVKFSKSGNTRLIDLKQIKSN